MAKTSAQAMITLLAKRMGHDPADTVNVRPDMLQQLNISQQAICREHSLRFLVANGTLTVTSSSAAVPATIDDSKTMTLGRPSGDGDIVYIEIDRWYRENVDTYGGITQTEPTVYTIAGSTFLFKPPSLSVSVPYLAQARVIAMTDASDSTSDLPEGWEMTLLIIDAEYELRRVNNEPQTAELRARVEAGREALYGSYRTSKYQQKTDREQKERKIEKAQLSDEAAP